jgi:hypothetical protein
MQPLSQFAEHGTIAGVTIGVDPYQSVQELGAQIPPRNVNNPGLYRLKPASSRAYELHGHNLIHILGSTEYMRK